MVIRVADYCGKKGYDLEANYVQTPEPKYTAEFEELLARINFSLSQAWANILLGPSSGWQWQSDMPLKQLRLVK